MKRIRVLPGLVILLLMSGPALGITVIDEFDQGPMLEITADDGWNASSPTTATQNGGLTTVLGGQRNVTLAWISGDGSGSTRAVVNTTAEVFRFSDDVNIVGEVLVEYGLGSGGMDEDLTDGSTVTDISFVYTRADAVSDFKVYFSDTSSATVYSKSFAVPEVGVADPAAYVIINYADPAFSLLNFGNIDYMAFKVTGIDSGDYEIDDIVTGAIPEPVTMAGLMLGIGALGGYIRRRRA